jgi:hypothetical protein
VVGYAADEVTSCRQEGVPKAEGPPGAATGNVGQKVRQRIPELAWLEELQLVREGGAESGRPQRESIKDPTTNKFEIFPCFMRIF